MSNHRKNIVRRTICVCVMWITILFAASWISDITAGEGDEAKPCLSPADVVISQDGATAFVALETACRIAVFDVADRTVTAYIPFEDPVRGLTLSPDGAFLYATIGDVGGMVAVIETGSNEPAWTIPVGHTPQSPVTSPDGRTLYVCNRFDGTLSVIDLKKRMEIKRLKVSREPVASAMLPDGSFLFVAGHLPSFEGYGSIGPHEEYSSVLKYPVNSLSVVTTDENKVSSLIPLPRGTTGVKGICVSPDGRYVYVTHILARYLDPTVSVERGAINTNAVSVIDVEAMNYVNTVLLDDADRGAANPWGIACTPDGRYLCVAHAGTHELSVIERDPFHEKLALVSSRGKVFEPGTPAAELQKDLTFLDGMRRRISLGGNGPREIAVSGSKVYAAEYFTGTLGIADLGEGNDDVVSVALGDEPPASPVRLGEWYFNDARFCLHEWQSCASCHPDGRADALKWDLLNDGIGNPKDTKSLLLSHKTPPAMFTGVRPDAETAVRAGFSHILFNEPSEDVAGAVDAYLKSLEPLSSPYLEEGLLSAEGERGKEVFFRAGCAECHPAPLYTDGKLYDVGSGAGPEQGRRFDTPTLVELWRTSPYLYDGRAMKIRHVFSKYNRRDRHGTTSCLSDREIADLCIYLLSL